MVGWKKMQNVDGYDVFVAKCGTREYQLYKSVSAGKESLKITGLEKSVSYKVIIRAFVREAGGEKTYVHKSMTVHCYTNGGDDKYTNTKEVKLKPKTLTLPVGGTEQIGVTLVPEVAGKKPIEHLEGIYY